MWLIRMLTVFASFIELPHPIHSSFLLCTLDLLLMAEKIVLVYQA